MHTSFQLQSKEEFEAATGTRAPAGKRYFTHHKLADIIGAYPLPNVSQQLLPGAQHSGPRSREPLGSRDRGTEPL